MTPERPSSTDPVVLPGWTWQPFLDDAVKALHPFDIEPYPVAEEFLQKQDITGSRSKPVTVTTATWACRTKNSVRYGPLV